MATQNPIEMEGTYPLPEAQLDRFLMKILVHYPSREDLSAIVERTIQKDEDRGAAGARPRGDPGSARRVPSGAGRAARAGSRHRSGDGHAAGYGDGHELASKFIRYGSSPRGAQALVECGRVLALMQGPLAPFDRRCATPWRPPFCGTASF